MKQQMPQEIEVWYIIPALRKELAKAMLDRDLTQKKIAALMGITEAAVSQYLHSKRAKEVEFSNAVLDAISEAATRIIAHPESMMTEMMHLTKMTQVKRVMCDIHRKQGSSLPKSCDVCFEDDLVQVK